MLPQKGMHRRLYTAKVVSVDEGLFIAGTKGLAWFFGWLIEVFGKKEKRTQISFRLTENAFHRLKQCADLFNMEPSQYAKAVLYRELGPCQEPVDQRHRKWIQEHRVQKENVDF